MTLLGLLSLRQTNRHDIDVNHNHTQFSVYIVMLTGSDFGIAFTSPNKDMTAFI